MTLETNINVAYAAFINDYRQQLMKTNTAPDSMMTDEATKRRDAITSAGRNPALEVAVEAGNEFIDKIVDPSSSEMISTTSSWDDIAW